MVQGAVYDAVNAIDGGHEPYLLDLALDPPAGGSYDAAHRHGGPPRAGRDRLRRTVAALERAYAATLAASMTVRRGRRRRRRRGGSGGDARRTDRRLHGAVRVRDRDRAWRLAPDGPPTALDPDAWVGI